MASEVVKRAGKDASLAHQVGVLRAVRAVIVMGHRLDRYRESELQMETVPFNNLPPKEGRQAIAEYLVYKFFPDKADESLFSPALASFKREMLVESEKMKDPFDFLFTMIYACKCDWQRYIANMPSGGRLGGVS